MSTKDTVATKGTKMRKHNYTHQFNKSGNIIQVKPVEAKCLKCDAKYMNLKAYKRGICPTCTNLNNSYYNTQEHKIELY